MKSLVKKVLAGALISGLMAPVQAGIVNTFTDRSSWEAAVGAGNFVTEEFDVASDTQLTNNVVNDVGEFGIFYTTSGGVDESSNSVKNSTGTFVGGLLVDDYLLLQWDTMGTDSTTALEFRFDSPINAFAANFLDVESADDLTLTLDGTAVNLFDAMGGAGTSGFLGWSLDNAVSSIAFSTNGGGEFFSMDNVSLGNVSAVPAPAAVWLMDSGLVGLLGFGRRKKA